MGTPRKTQTAKAVDATIKGKDPLAESEAAAMHEALKNILSGDVLSPARLVAALVGGCITAGLAGYAAGTLLVYTIVGSTLLNGSALLAFLITILGILIGIHFATRLGSFVSEAVMTKQIDAAYYATKNFVIAAPDRLRALFQRNEVAVQS